MTNALLTPFDLSEAVKTGRRRFWKRILPKTEITYKGQKVNFDDAFHTDLAEAFRKEAYEQVPLVFADGENRHNMDPRNFGGEILDMQARTDGTWALIEADKEAARAITKNPKLGVSARIVQGLQKADGRSFNRAVNHVLLTMNPRVSGLGPWQAVDLSDEDADIEVVDLTAESYEEGNPMGTTKTKPKATGDASGREIDLSALSDDEFQELLDFTATLTADPEVDPDEVEDDEDEDDTPTARRVRRKKSKTKITVEKDSEDDGDEPDDDEDETDLSDPVIDTETRATVRQMQMDLAEQRWTAERSELERAGVPPFLLDLAEPVLSQPEALTIDLSDDETIDASDTIRKMLNGVRGVMDFTDELGHQIDLSQEPEDKDKALLDAWDAENYG